MTPVLGLYQGKHGLIDPWFVPPAMALGVRQILLPLQGSNWRKAKPRNEVKWRSRGGSLEDAPRLQTTHKSGNWNAQISNDSSSEGWSFDLPTQVSAVHLASNGAVGEREGKMSALLLPVNCLLISIKNSETSAKSLQMCQKKWRLKSSAASNSSKVKR